MPNPFPTIDPKHLIAYGKVRRTHGNQGEVILALVSPAFEVLEPQFLFLLIDEIPVPYRLASIRGGGEQFIIGFEGVDTLTDAETLVGLEAQIHQDELPEEHSNISLTFRNYQLQHVGGELIGRIVDIDSSTTNILILIERPNHSEVTIPLVEQWIASIDDHHRIITMDFPLELLDL